MSYRVRAARGFDSVDVRPQEAEAEFKSGFSLLLFPSSEQQQRNIEVNPLGGVFERHCGEIEELVRLNLEETRQVGEHGCIRDKYLSTNTLPHRSYHCFIIVSIPLFCGSTAVRLECVITAVSNPANIARRESC